MTNKKELIKEVLKRANREQKLKIISNIHEVEKTADEVLQFEEFEEAISSIFLFVNLVLDSKDNITIIKQSKMDRLIDKITSLNLSLKKKESKEYKQIKDKDKRIKNIIKCLIKFNINKIEAFGDTHFEIASNIEKEWYYLNDNKLRKKVLELIEGTL